MPVNLVDIINGYNYGPTVSCPIGGPSTTGGGGEAPATTPVVFNFTTIPDGVVQQETVYNLDISGSAPIFVQTLVPPELVNFVRIVYLPGGTVQFRCVAPFEGNTTDVTKVVQFSASNSDPATPPDNPAVLNANWTIHPNSQNASWGTTPTALPQGKVGQVYSFYATGITGTGPYKVTLQAGLTAAQLANAGLAVNAASIVDPATDSIIVGTPLAGSEGTALASSVTLRLQGVTGVTTDLVCPSGIIINRTPGINLQSIPTFQTAGTVNFDFKPYIVGYPTPTITVKDGYSLPAKFSLSGNVLTATGITSGDNGTSSDIVFVLANGFDSPTEVPFKISVNIAGTVTGVCPNSIYSVSKNAYCNGGTLISSLADGTEIKTIADIGSGLIALNNTDAAITVHDGAVYSTSSSSWAYRDGTGDTRQSLGILYNIGIGPKWLLMRIRMPNTQQAGECNVCVLGPSWIGFTKDGGGAGNDLFKLHTGTAVLSSMNISAIGNFINILFYVVDQNHAGICYGTGGTITADTGSTLVNNIDSAWDRIIFSPSYMQAADTDQQCFAFGIGPVN